MKSVFAITTLKFTKVDDFGDSLLRLRRRTVGLFRSLEEAQTILNKNYGELNERGYYPWAVIEEVEFGLYPYRHRQQLFYRYEHDGEFWGEVIGVPEEIKKYMGKQSIVSFAEIG